jgi:hypothetical protein
MNYEVVWHGPVHDVLYVVEAGTEDDALQEVARALNEDDDEWLDGHLVADDDQEDD